MESHEMVKAQGADVKYIQTYIVLNLFQEISLQVQWVWSALFTSVGQPL